VRDGDTDFIIELAPLGFERNIHDQPCGDVVR